VKISWNCHVSRRERLWCDLELVPWFCGSSLSCGRNFSTFVLTWGWSKHVLQGLPRCFWSDFPLLDHDSGFGEGNVRTRKTPTSGGLCQYNIYIYIHTARSNHVRKVNIKHTYIIQIRKYTSASATTQSRNTSDSGRPCSPFYLRRALIDMFFRQISQDVLSKIDMLSWDDWMHITI
jgi:hypothetical protein